MILQVPINRASRISWEPRYLPDPAVAVTAVLKAGNNTANVAMSSIGNFEITSVPDRHRLRHLGGASAGVLPAQLGGGVGDGGLFWFYAQGVGSIPVRVSHYENASEDFILSEPLPIEVPADTTGKIYHRRFSGTIPAGALGDSVERGGYWAIDWTTDPDLQIENTAPAAIASGAFTDRGPLRVVRAIFDTGLTHDVLLTLVPSMAASVPQGRNSWQAMIDDMSDQIIGEIETRLPQQNFADQTLGSQWKLGAALYVAAHAARVGYVANVNADKLAEHAAAELDRVAARVSWLDSNDDGVVGTSETSINSLSLVGITRSSGADTERDYFEGVRERFKVESER